MQPAKPISTAIPPITTSVSSENNSCCTRTTKIALAIFVSLAAFVFLPFGWALALSAIVTLGAIGCDDNNVPPSVAARPSDDNLSANRVSAAGVASSAGPANAPKTPMPQRVTVSDTLVAVYYTSPAEKETFMKVAPNSFFQSYWSDWDEDFSSFDVMPHPGSPLTLQDIVTELKHVYGKDLNIIYSQPRPSRSDDRSSSSLQEVRAPSSVKAAPVVRPKPERICINDGQLCLLFSTEEEQEAFCSASEKFLDQYTYEVDGDGTELEINYDGITDSGTIIAQIKGLYPRHAFLL